MMNTMFSIAKRDEMSWNEVDFMVELNEANFSVSHASLGDSETT